MAGQQHQDIRPGLRAEIILKKDQRSGKRTIGIAQDSLTSLPIIHAGPRGGWMSAKLDVYRLS